MVAWPKPGRNVGVENESGEQRRVGSGMASKTRQRRAAASV